MLQRLTCRATESLEKREHNTSDTLHKCLACASINCVIVLRRKSSSQRTCDQSCIFGRATVPHVVYEVVQVRYSHTIDIDWLDQN